MKLIRMKALIIFGTRGGATKKIADEIGKVFGEQGYVVTVADARQSRKVDVNAFDLIVVGSSVWATMWKWQATRFLKRNAKKLARKKVALFSSGLLGGDPAKTEEARKSIEKQAARFPGVRPIGLAYFGGFIDLLNPGFFVKPVAGAMKKDLEKKGIEAGPSYDTRDFPAVRQWAADVAAKAKA
jgi:menaquinone-dependent protoporphyrinogen oxidase